MAAADTPNLNPRRSLATLIAGYAPPPGAMEDLPGQALLDSARDEGVAALVHQRLIEDPSVSASLRDVFAPAARDAAVASLLRETECRRVLGALASAGISVLLLKGSALAWWLYPEPSLRECCDIDLLFPSRELAQHAAALLGANGYVQHHRPEQSSYELLCRRTVGLMQFDLDMHWCLVNVPFFAELFDFATLEAAAIPLPRLATGARGLGPVHAFMHASVHRAVNLSLGTGDGLKWLYDLHLLGQRMSASEWSALQKQCRARGLGGICASGIDAAAELFGTVVPESELQSLQDAATHESLDASRLHDWKYMQGRNLAALPSLRMRARWLWQRMFPPVGYLQVLYGAERSVASLWMQRARHAIGRLRS